LRAPAPVGDNYRELKDLVTRLKLHTVCESAACPNVGECWNRRTATFMILGNVCTRRCGFCAVQKGGPLPVDYDEPRRVGEACAALGAAYAVVTSVNRDDRKDGGAELFALTIAAIREQVPGCKVEVLVPDFQGSHSGHGDGDERGAGCAESQYGDGAAAVPAGAFGRAYKSVRSTCCSMRRRCGRRRR
jgi:lipoic acid synthetase